MCGDTQQATRVNWRVGAHPLVGRRLAQGKWSISETGEPIPAKTLQRTQSLGSARLGARLELPKVSTLRNLCWCCAEFPGAGDGGNCGRTRRWLNLKQQQPHRGSVGARPDRRHFVLCVASDYCLQQGSRCDVHFFRSHLQSASRAC